MIKGIGNDIIEISRIKKAAEKESFIKRWFDAEEISFFEERKMSAQTIAGSFAAKEAVSKAFGSGFSGFGAEEVLILRNETGAPFVKLKGKAKEKAEMLGVTKIWVSISHCKDYAAATAVCEGDEQP